jgi:FAD/FMN-containing dehydrogenase
LSGEHGIGNDKSAYMPLVFGEATQKLQLAVPAVFDRASQLNPGKVFEGRVYHA